MRPFSTDELEHIRLALSAFGEVSETLTNAQVKVLKNHIVGEISRRDHVASAQEHTPKARPVQYNRGGAIVTVYETPMAAHGVKAPRKSADGSGVKITDVDTLLMMMGDADDLIPEA